MTVHLVHHTRATPLAIDPFQQLTTMIEECTHSHVPRTFSESIEQNEKLRALISPFLASLPEEEMVQLALQWTKQELGSLRSQISFEVIFSCFPLTEKQLLEIIQQIITSIDPRRITDLIPLTKTVSEQTRCALLKLIIEYAREEDDISISIALEKCHLPKEARKELAHTIAMHKPEWLTDTVKGLHIVGEQSYTHHHFITAVPQHCPLKLVDQFKRRIETTRCGERIEVDCLEQWIDKKENIERGAHVYVLGHGKAASSLIYADIQESEPNGSYSVDTVADALFPNPSDPICNSQDPTLAPYTISLLVCEGANGGEDSFLSQLTTRLHSKGICNFEVSGRVPVLIAPGSIQTALAAAIGMRGGGPEGKTTVDKADVQGINARGELIFPLDKVAHQKRGSKLKMRVDSRGNRSCVDAYIDKAERVSRELMQEIHHTLSSEQRAPIQSLLREIDEIHSTPLSRENGRRLFRSWDEIATRLDQSSEPEALLCASYINRFYESRQGSV